MNTNTRSKLANLLLALALPSIALAQAPTDPKGGQGSGKPTDTNKTGSDATGTGTTGTGTTGAGTGTTGTTGTGAFHGQLSDPAALFQRLDTDKDGKLSQSEFARISDTLRPQGAAGAAHPTGAANEKDNTPKGTDDPKSPPR